MKMVEFNRDTAPAYGKRKKERRANREERNRFLSTKDIDDIRFPTTDSN